MELEAIARDIIDSNHYMVLGTADENGSPWVCPVFYLSQGYSTFYWMSALETIHSRNISTRPQISVVIFDSQAPSGTGQAVYMSARADELRQEEVEEVLPAYLRRWGGEVTASELLGMAPRRLYRASARQHWLRCPRDATACFEHGSPFDHRVPTSP